MYRFRTTFEMNQMQIRRFLLLYTKSANMRSLIVFVSLACVMLGIAVYFVVGQKNMLKMLFFLIVSGICCVLHMVLCLIRLEILTKHPPYAIGGYITMEMQDGFFHVNCSGQMKSYSKGDLMKYTGKGKIEDYILFKKKKPFFGKRDMIVIPAEVLTDLIRTELDRFLGEVEQSIET